MMNIWMYIHIIELMKVAKSNMDFFHQRALLQMISNCLMWEINPFDDHPKPCNTTGITITTRNTELLTTDSC